MVAAELPEGPLQGHTFHYSTSTTPLTPIAQAIKANVGAKGKGGEAVYRRQRLTASYMHIYFPSNPQAAAGLFR